MSRLFAILLLSAFAGGIFAVPLSARAQINAAGSIAAEAAAVSLAEGACTAAAAGALLGNPSPLIVPVIDTAQYIQKCADNTNGAIRTGTSIWDKFMTRILNPLARQILRLVIREMKRMTLNYIITGNFGAPMFVTNFQLDAQQVAENAARSFLSQLTNINFCGFFPTPIQAVYTFNINFQFVCTVSSAQYSQFLQDPVQLTEIERILAFDPSTNYPQTIASLGQNKAQVLAQALVARSAQTAGGFIGDVFQTITGEDQREFELRKQTAYEDAYRRELDRTQNDALARQAGESASARIPPPTPQERIRTPGQVTRDILHDAVSTDFLYPTVATEFDQAIVEIVDTAMSVIINRGLSEVFQR